MTIAAELETRIGRPLPAVYDELVAIERYPEWLVASGIVGVERLDPGPLREGARVIIRQQVAGRSSTVEAIVTVIEPGARFGLEGRDRDGVRIRIDALAWADSPVTTVVRWSIRVDLPLRFRMLEGMIAPQAQRAVALDLEAFKRRMESVADG